MYANQSQTIPLGMDFALSFVPVAALDITGWTLLFTVSPELPQRDEGGQLVPAAFSAVPLVIDAPNGLFKVIVDSADCQAIGAGTFFYSVWRTDTGYNDEIASGQLVIQDTSRRYAA